MHSHLVSETIKKCHTSVVEPANVFSQLAFHTPAKSRWHGGDYWGISANVLSMARWGVLLTI